MKKYTYDLNVTYNKKCEVLANSRNEANERIENMWNDHFSDSVPDKIGDEPLNLEYDNHEINYLYETEIKEVKEDTEKKTENVIDKSMSKYTYMVKAIYNGTVSVEADSEAAAEDMVDDIYHSEIIDELPDFFSCGDIKFAFADDEITLERSVPVKEKRDTDVKEVNVLSPENVFGMITAINESYRKLYTERK